MAWFWGVSESGFDDSNSFLISALSPIPVRFLITPHSLLPVVGGKKSIKGFGLGFYEAVLWASAMDGWAAWLARGGTNGSNQDYQLNSGEIYNNEST